MGDKNLNSNVFEIVNLALDEDLGLLGDITSSATIPEDSISRFLVRSRKPGVLSGSGVSSSVVNKIDPNIELTWKKIDGDLLSEAEVIAELYGNTRSILKAERTFLNFLCHLSGIATQTRQYVDLLRESGSVSIVRDTRKTTPGLREVEKRAVVHGGGENHRMGLYDAFLIKDNHIGNSDLSSIVEKCRALNSEVPLEIEIDSLDQLETVVPHEPDLILLDNFSIEDIKRAQSLFPSATFEVSGGIDLSNVVEYGSTNVKYIAIGALTHSSKILDIGLDVQ